MNNYYGYIYKNPFEKVHIPPPIEEPSGLWNSKKNRQRIEKEANLLHNRVNLLHQEEYKIGKKILETKKKMHEFIEKKRRDYQELYQKGKKKVNDEQLLIEKRKRNYSSKKDGEMIMASRTSEIEKLKRSETVELKKVREMSVNKIKEYRNQLLDNKRSQYLMVKSSEDLIKKNIQSYWERKKNYFLNLHKSLKNENEKFLLIKEKEIYDLEKNEENLIRRLEQSQNVDESTFKELEEVILTPLEQFIQKYGEDKIEKKEIRKKSNCQFITSRNLNKENDEKEICSKSLLLEDTPRLKLNLETVNSKSKNR